MQQEVQQFFCIWGIFFLQATHTKSQNFKKLQKKEKRKKRGPFLIQQQISPIVLGMRIVGNAFLVCAICAF